MESLSSPVSGPGHNSINIPNDVYDSLLAEIWSLFRNIDGVADKPPPLSERLPRRGGHPETLQEYVDAHHPLWTRIRELMADKTVSRRRRVEFIRKEWGGQGVNPLADLSYLPTTSAATNANGSIRHDETETESRTERQRVLANENQRLEIFKIKRSQFIEAQRMKRKRKLDEPSSSSDTRPSDALSKEECESKFLILAHNNKVNPVAAAPCLMNIEELFNLKSAYSNENNQTIKISNEEMNNFLASQFYFLNVAQSYGDPFNEDEEADRSETENSEAENPTGLWHQDNFDKSIMFYF